MKLYHPSGRHHTIFVTPGLEHDVAKWRDANGTPIQFQIRFEDGACDVDNEMGGYLLEKKLASRIRPVLKPLLV